MDPARIVADHLIWESIRAECTEAAANESLLAGFLLHVVPSRPDLETALAYVLAAKLNNTTLSAPSLHDIILDVLHDEECTQSAVRTDLQTVVQRDPTAARYTNPLLYFKGFHSVQAYRTAHSYWERGRRALTLYLQSRISEVFAADIHPVARIGKGVMFDHATSVVIDETMMVEDDFPILHGVTLGGPGEEGGDHHPEVGHDVTIEAEVRVLGNIRIGEGAKVGAGSVMLKDIPPYTTIAEIPARVVNVSSTALPALDMDQFLPSAQQRLELLRVNNLANHVTRIDRLPRGDDYPHHLAGPVGM